MLKPLLALLPFVLTACADGPIKLDASGEDQVSSSDFVSIAISESDRQRLDQFVMLGQRGRQPVETGPVWWRVFAGTDPDVTLTVKSAELRQTIAGGGFTTRFTYTAQCELLDRGKIYSINASGTRAAAMLKMSAMRQAVELGVVDAAHQAKALIEIKE